MLIQCICKHNVIIKLHCRLDSREHHARHRTVMSSIEKTGTYNMTTEELEFGVKMAWRNAPRCIGRMQWNTLKVYL